MSRKLAIAALFLAALAPARSAWGQAKPAVQADPAAAAFKAWDKNADGQLSLVEFRAGWERTQAIARSQMLLRRQFAAVDANHDGALDAGEYGRLLLVRNAGAAAPALGKFDADANGKLTFPEYVRLVETLAPKEASSRVRTP